ncbi:MAG: thioredoxin family protein, partial [Deltaproteobacteria bacterium]|nr:thioredoxin family protein [Deltaproteobacteria bacterium]
MSSEAQYDRAVAEAERACRPVLVDFHAAWCTDCGWMEEHVWAEPGIRAAAGDDVALVRVDATGGLDGASAVAARLGVAGLPALRFLDRTGQPVGGLAFDGRAEARPVRDAISRLASLPSD